MASFELGVDHSVILAPNFGCGANFVFRRIIQKRSRQFEALRVSRSNFSLAT